MGRTRCGRGKGKVGKDLGREVGGKNGGRGATKMPGRAGGVGAWATRSADWGNRRSGNIENTATTSLLFTGRFGLGQVPAERADQGRT